MLHLFVVVAPTKITRLEEGMSREAGYQTKTVNYARQQGYMAKRNYMGPGCEVGWPDVEIFMNRGRVLLIEFKVLGKDLKRIQSYRATELRKMGFRVVTCFSFEEAKKEIDDYR